MNKPKIKSVKWLISTIENIDKASYYHKRILIKEGYIEVQKVKSTVGKGRPTNIYKYTGKALPSV